MSSNVIKNDKWVEDLQRKFFDECVVQSQLLNKYSTQDVPVSVIMKNIQEFFQEKQFFRFILMGKRQRIDFLEDLKTSLQKDSKEEVCLNWFQFRDLSSYWFHALIKLNVQDGNNNLHTNDRDVSADNSKRKSFHFRDEYACNDTLVDGNNDDDDDNDINDDESNLYSINQTSTIESPYSINSTNMECSVTNSRVESSKETSQVNEDFTGADLKLHHIKRINKENTHLRDEISQLEEINTSLEKDIMLIKKKLEQVTNKYTSLQKEYDKQKEILVESEQQERLCKSNLRKLEKIYSIAQKKIEELEANKENISNLKEKIGMISKENVEYTQQISDYKKKYEEKEIEYKLLEERCNELQNDKNALEKVYEKNFQQQQEQIEELKNLNFELQSKMNKSDSSSSRLSITPPPCSFFDMHIHSTPYSNKKILDSESLYSELKASGFNSDDDYVQDIKEKFSIYNEEMTDMVNALDEALQDVKKMKNDISVANLQHVEMNICEELKYKITTFINLVKTYIATKESSVTRRVPDSREKPDVLPETKNSDLSGDRVFTSDEREKIFIGSVTTTTTTMLPKHVHSKSDKSTILTIDTINSTENSEAITNSEKKNIEPMSQNLNRIMELKGIDNQKEAETIIRQKHISTPKSTHIIKNKDGPNILPKTTQFNDLSSIKNAEEYINSPTFINAKGDGPNYNNVVMNEYNSQKFQKHDSTESESNCTEYGIHEEKTMNDVDKILVRSADKTYTLNPVVSSTGENSQSKSEDFKSEAMYCDTPVHNQKTRSHRKASICYGSCDIYNLQTSYSSQNVDDEKICSIGTSDVQKSEHVDFKSLQPLEKIVINDQLHNTYSYSNSSDLTNTFILQKNKYSVYKNIDESRCKVIKTSNFKYPDSTVKQNFQKNSEFENSRENILSQQSNILSPSLNFLGKKEKRMKSDMIPITLDSKNENSSILLSECTNASTITIFSNHCAINNLNVQDNLLLPIQHINDQTYTKKDLDIAGKRQRGATDAPSTSGAVAIAAITVREEASSRCSSEESSKRASPVERVMSSGEEDSSAESECDPQPIENEIEEPVFGRRRHNSDTPPQQDKVEVQGNINNGDIENNCSEITSNSLTQELIKEDESLKVFPSLTNERLKESGIANLSDMSLEISENLSEDELKTKYTSFSIGLETDRLTLLKRITLSRRHRDQAEKNFLNEVFKMQKDIKELAPLCIDSESVERVERVKQQLEMVSRCAHRISCSAETLGAVHQERRISRAVLLADRYLQTLRMKYEKLVAELAETKRILAENNIMLEENLSEMGDDFPRVRYRGVPNNNRTMMARRRASIATISRPLMGSNQDISKELPRQRNSISGKVSGLRRPSLCFDTSKFEIEKLDRTDSSTSIIEVSEQTESRRHSQEENNNLSRSSMKNISTNSSEYIEEDEVWSGVREDFVSESLHENEIILSESRQQYRHPLICWLLNRYISWKPTLWCILIAFILGFFINRVVSSSMRNGPPISWWSIEEMLNQYIQVKNEKRAVPRPI